MLINFSIKQSTVGGTPTPELRLMIPGGYTAGSQVLTPITLYDRWDGRTYQQSVGTVGVSTPGINYLQIRKLDNQNWELSDSTYVIGQIIVELCADGVVCAYEK
jgi:hypothetical protein